ncbi:gp436 family protein [Tianweitania sediminis]|uniref:DUF1320 domain-containing protein n=1 Tax=Tianweitania sediminis TaxID=1502156 RepID=A0A8J7R251_9HYPH|nr:DUF1320 domain-containing protein [Tianweitania sediminis]
MTYATKQDLIDRFGSTELEQLTDRVNRPPSTIDDVTLERALTDASALADGYLRKVVALPLQDVPPVLVKKVADIARYYLHGKAADKEGPVLRAYNEAVSWLKDVARGLIELSGPAGGADPQPAGGGQIRTSAPNRTFTRDSLRGA